MSITSDGWDAHAKRCADCGSMLHYRGNATTIGLSSYPCVNKFTDAIRECLFITKEVTYVTAPEPPWLFPPFRDVTLRGEKQLAPSYIGGPSGPPNPPAL